MVARGRLTASTPQTSRAVLSVTNGARTEDEVFVATGLHFAGALAEARSELRVGSVLHVNSQLPAGTAVLPDQHEQLWAVRDSLDFRHDLRGAARHICAPRRASFSELYAS